MEILSFGGYTFSMTAAKNMEGLALALTFHARLAQWVK